MKFNPSDKSQSIIADIDFLLWGDGSTLNTKYSLIDRTRNINIALDEVVTELHKADPNYKWDDSNNTDFPIATLAITSGLDHYSLIDSALIINRVRMKDANGVLRTLNPRSRNELSDDELNSSGSPTVYYKSGGAIFPIAVPNYSVADGVEIEFQRGSNYFTTSDTDKSPGFNPQFHPYLSISAALRFAISKGMKEKIAQLRADKKKIQDDILEHYLSRSREEIPRLKLKRASTKRFGL